MDLHQILIFGHIIGTAIGLGGATIADILFFRSIRDKKISHDEYLTLKLLSKIIMTGFIFLIISGLGFLVLLYVNYGSLAGMPDRMLAKLCIVAVIFLNSQVLARKVLPLLHQSIGKNIQPILEQHSLVILTSGTVSIISWYSTIILAMWREIPFTFTEIMGIYGGLLLAVLILLNSIGIKRLSKFLFS